jgi:copper chaperone CopZ
MLFGKKKEVYTAKAKVSGMMCQMCVKHVTDSLSAVKDVKKVVVSLSEGTAVITSTRPLSEDEIKASITASGYGYEGLIK